MKYYENPLDEDQYDDFFDRYTEFNDKMIEFREK